MYALMSRELAAIGLESPAPRSRIPYSVSMPQIFRMATGRGYRPGRRRSGAGQTEHRVAPHRPVPDGTVRSYVGHMTSPMVCL